MGVCARCSGRGRRGRHVGGLCALHSPPAIADQAPGFDDDDRTDATRVAARGIGVGIRTRIGIDCAPRALELPPKHGRNPQAAFVGTDGKMRNIAPYCIDRTEVTVASFTRCMDAHACTEPGRERGCNWGDTERAQHPINCIDYSQAATYCAWAGGRIPTEDEWLWVARGGDIGSLYPWGNDAPVRQLCWNGEGNSEGKGGRKSTCPVGSYAAGNNPWGVQDLAGNVWEFVGTPMSAGGAHTVAGGGFNDDDSTDVSAYGRGHGPPMYRYFNIGVRCAKTP